jgi:hypothetical protein
MLERDGQIMIDGVAARCTARRNRIFRRRITGARRECTLKWPAR